MIRRFPYLFFFVILGCDSEHTGHTRDAGFVRDAALIDGGEVLLDAGGWAREDAGASADGGRNPYCEIGACDPRVPDCADGSCALWGEASSCEESAGTYPADTPCEDVSDCAPGLACFATPEGGGVCGRICCPAEPDDCVGDAVCGGAGVLVDGTETRWGRCLPRRSCDVLAPEEACGEREACYIVDSSGATECRIAGSAGADEPCVVQQDCQSGFFCGATRRCVRICRLGDECPPGEGRCVAQHHSPEGTGICTRSAPR